MDNLTPEQLKKLSLDRLDDAKALYAAGCCDGASEKFKFTIKRAYLLRSQK